jgi:isochorismate synthase
MSIIRLRLPQENIEKNLDAARSFVLKSDFRGEVNRDSSDSEYAESVAQCVELLKQDQAKKIVLSRIISFPHQGLTADSIFAVLNEKFPSAAVFAFTDEHNVTWLGASPELLFRKRREVYQTISLAGTRKTGSEEPWGEKEREEQRLVTDFIQRELENMGAENIVLGEVKSRTAGSVEHLCTEIQFEYSGDWKNVMKALHPTPAVCGLPRAEAMRLIQQLEKHDREYYTGLIGMEQGSSVDVYVILRCMKLSTKRIDVFVGAGITDSSVPELEARETRWKAESLTEVIF